MNKKLVNSFVTALAVAAIFLSGIEVVNGAVARFPVPIAVCGGTCGGSPVVVMPPPALPTCASAATGYTCTNIGNSVFNCSACISNTAAPGFCRCQLT